MGWRGSPAGMAKPRVTMRFRWRSIRLLVSEIYSALAPDMAEKTRLYALLHDAAEYVMGDIISPLKAAMGGDYKHVETRLLGAIHIRFALAPTPPAAIARLIKKSDREAAYFEAVHLAGFEPEEARKYFGEPSLPGFDLTDFDRLIRPWPTQEAHDRFVSAFDEISG